MKKLTLLLFLLSIFLGYSQETPTSTQAQDWNSSRSNKTSKTSSITNPDGNNPPPATQAQDWNSSRSNKTSKTSSVSNPDVNNPPPSTQAQDWNSSRSNKTSKTSSITNPDGNNPSTEKDIRKNITLGLSSGISALSSTFKNNGFTSNGSFIRFDGAYYISKFGIGLSVGQISSKTNNNFSSSINSADIATTNTTQNWKQFYFEVGPEYKTQFGNFSTTFSTKIGLQSVKSVNLESNYNNGETSIPILKIKSDKNSSLSYFSTDLKFDYNLRSNLSLYVIANYMSAFSNGITISESKITDTNKNGIIDAEDLKIATGSATIDYQESTKKLKPQSTNFGIGVSYTFSSKKGYDYSHRLTRGKKSRTGDPNNTKYIRKRPGRTKYSNITLKRNQSNEYGNNSIKAMDHNASRSITTASKIDSKGNGSDTNTTRKGKRKAKKECLEAGGSFWESSNGSYYCMNQLELSRTSSETNSENELHRYGKRKCWRAGGTWVTNSHGSFCWNPNTTSKIDNNSSESPEIVKNKVKEVIKKKEAVKNSINPQNPQDDENSQNRRRKGYDYYKAKSDMTKTTDNSHNQTAKKECIKTGSVFWENANGSYSCQTSIQKKRKPKNYIRKKLAGELATAIKAALTDKTQQGVIEITVMYPEKNETVIVSIPSEKIQETESILQDVIESTEGNGDKDKNGKVRIKYVAKL